MKRFQFQILLLLLCIYSSLAYSQSDLFKYSFRQDHLFKKQHQLAIKIFENHNYKYSYEFSNGQNLELYKFQNGVPLFYTTHNSSIAEYIGVNSIYLTSEFHEALSGKYIEVGLWDAGHALKAHQEFTNDEQSRIIINNEVPNYKNHTSHVAGTIAAFGVNPLAKGMAFESTLFSYDFMNDLSEMSKEAEKRVSFISNHSYGPVSGWLYNSIEEQWYWYGDLGIDVEEDYKFGFYGTISYNLDQLAKLAPYYLMVVSSGNDRDDSPESQPITHKVWTDKWKSSSDIRKDDGGELGYDCLGMNAVAKNVLTVGAIDSGNDGEMSVFSAWGPTDDGRIKPDIVAPGVSVLSTVAENDTEYGYYSGTSMSTACVTGGLVLIQELQEKLRPGIPLLSSTLKGILIHTADNTELDYGPSYKYGWGTVNFLNAYNFLVDNVSSGGCKVLEKKLLKGQLFYFDVYVEENDKLITTIVWTDSPANESLPILNSTEIKLVNDIDLRIERLNDGTVYFPWILDPVNPEKQAQRGVNIRDNVEQVLVENTQSGIYRIYVDGAKLKDSIQDFSLLITGNKSKEALFPPKNLDGFYVENGIKIYWDVPIQESADYYRIYKNLELIDSTMNLYYIDEEINYEIINNYEITACYMNDGVDNSCISNNVEIRTLPILKLDHSEDFESEPTWWTYKNDSYGWKWGNSDELSSYYLKFDDNQSNFMGVNSDILGSNEHVQDYLISQPFKVSDDAYLKINFKYFFNNEQYETEDKFVLVYRKSINSDWIIIKNIESGSGWQEFQDSLKFDIEDTYIQLAFMYDDNGNWGFGAAIDDLVLNESVVNLSLNYEDFDNNIISYIDENNNLRIKLKYSTLSIIENVLVYDICGRIIIDRKILANEVEEVLIPMSFLAKGSYIVSVKCSNFSHRRLINY